MNWGGGSFLASGKGRMWLGESRLFGGYSPYSPYCSMSILSVIKHQGDTNKNESCQGLRSSYHDQVEAEQLPSIPLPVFSLAVDSLSRFIQSGSIKAALPSNVRHLSGGLLTFLISRAHLPSFHSCHFQVVVLLMP